MEKTKSAEILDDCCMPDMSKLIPEVSERMKLARRKLPCSQQEVADAICMSKQAVSHIEQKKNKNVGLIKYLIFLRTKGVDLNGIFQP